MWPKADYLHWGPLVISQDLLHLLHLLQEFMGYMDLYRSVEAHLQCTDHLFVNGRKTLMPLDPFGARSTKRPSIYSSELQM